MRGVPPKSYGNPETAGPPRCPRAAPEKAAEKAGKDAAQAQLDLSEAEDDAADAEKALELRNWEVQGVTLKRKVQVLATFGIFFWT